MWSVAAAAAVGGFFGLASGQLESCSGTEADAHLAETGVAGNLRVVLHNPLDNCQRADSGLANQFYIPITNHDMREKCETFCYPAMPVVVGTVSDGFDIDDMNKICAESNHTVAEEDSVLLHDVELLNDCAQWGSSLDKIARRAADVVADARDLEYKQILLRTRMQIQARDMAEELQEEELQGILQRAPKEERAAIIKERIAANMNRLMQGGEDQRELENSMQALRNSAIALSEIVATEIPKASSFVNQCARLMLGQGPSREYLFDICAVEGETCVQNIPNARHAGCCCAVVPASGNQNMSASVLPRRSRRLEEQAEQVDVCGLAFQMSSEKVAETLRELMNLPGGPRQIQLHQEGQMELYEEFFGSNCVDLHQGERRRLAAQKDSDATPVRELQESALRNCPDVTETTEVDMGNGTNGTFPLKVARWTGSDHFCSTEALDLSQAVLSKTCEEYCGDAVPIRLGHATSFGLSQHIMDEVCLEPVSGQNARKFNRTAIARCHEQAASFDLLKQKISVMVGKLSVVQARQLLFKRRTSAQFQALSEGLSAQAAEVLQGASSQPGGKIAAYKGLFKDLINQHGNGAGVESADLREALQQFVVAAEHLQRTLTDTLPALESFLSQCNFLTTGIGREGDYLLNLCTKSGPECIDNVYAQTNGCCCAYNPVVTIGLTNINDHTISGLDGGDSSTPARRLQAAHTTDICAEAEAQSLDGMNQVRQEFRDLNQDNANQVNELDVFFARRDRQYPEYLARCAAAVLGITSTPNTIATTTTTTTHGGHSDCPCSDHGIVPLLTGQHNMDCPVDYGESWSPDWLAARSNGREWVAPSRCLAARVDSSSAPMPYPSDYGAGCKKHLEPGASACFHTERTPIAEKPEHGSDARASWCDHLWCYVDPCNCGSETRLSTYFEGREFAFSYATCGSPNEYSNQIRTQPAHCDTTRIAPNTNAANTSDNTALVSQIDGAFGSALNSLALMWILASFWRSLTWV